MASQSHFPRFEGFLADLAAIVADLVGADRVDLRTCERLPESEGNVAGAARIGSGRLFVGHHVPGFIEGVLAAPCCKPTAAELAHLRKTLGTLLHECIHLALPTDYTPSHARHWRAPPSRAFLEEGVTESATQVLLPRLLTRLEPVFPRVSCQIPDRSGHYLNYVPATRELVTLVSGLPEEPTREPLLELATVGPERKFDLLVELAMDGFGLMFNVPARDRMSVRSRIQATLEAHVERNCSWMDPPDPTKPGILSTREAGALSTIMGKQMGFELLRQLHAEGEQAGMELPVAWRQRLAGEELNMVAELSRSDGFTGPEARQALREWRSEAGSVPPESPHAWMSGGRRGQSIAGWHGRGKTPTFDAKRVCEVAR